MLFGGFATCEDLGAPFLFRDAQVYSSVSYAATIQTVDGVFTDSGDGDAFLEKFTCLPGSTLCVFDAEIFFENFYNSNGVLPLTRAGRRLAVVGSSPPAIPSTASRLASTSARVRSDRNSKEPAMSSIRWQERTSSASPSRATSRLGTRPPGWVSQRERRHWNYRIIVQDNGEPNSGLDTP